MNPYSHGISRHFVYVSDYIPEGKEGKESSLVWIMGPLGLWPFDDDAAMVLC